MEATEHSEEKITFREVYLSDLKSVINLYQRTFLNEPAKGSGIELTNDFGLPVGVAERNKKVIAYASVHIDHEGTTTFQIHADGKSESEEISVNLNHFSLKQFGKVWGTGEELGSGTPVKNAIARLVDWLNHCS